MATTAPAPTATAPAAASPGPGASTGLPAPGDSARATRVGLWALALGFGLFVLWAAFAPLDEGVPSQGMVAIDTKRKPVQHLSGGILKQVLVREGDAVQQGQLLIKMDDATARANYESVRQRYLGLRAMQARLQAERAGQRTVSFHPDLQAAAQDPLIRSQMQNQEQLMHTRQAALQAELQSIEESIEGQKAQLVSLDAMTSNRRTQLQLLTEELKHSRALVAEGYMPRNRQLELERQVSEITASIADLLGNTTRTQRAIGELRQRALLRQQEYRKEVESQLADVTREVQGDADKFQALREELARTELRAPADGQVVGLATQTVGAVVGPGQKLMDIVPVQQSLMLETRVAPQLIDRVRAGLPVDVRFSAFAHSPQLVVPGEVVSISADVLIEPQTNISYYLARVAVTPQGIRTLGARQMQPGMPVEVVFKTGERSLLTYLLHPLTKRVAASMTEE